MFSMFIYRHLGGFNEARIDIIRGKGKLNLILKIVTVYPYEEKVPELSRIPEIPLCPPFFKGEI